MPPKKKTAARKPAAKKSNKRKTEDIALGIRRRVFEHSMRNNGGYLSQACSAAEQLAWLYNDQLKLGDPTLPMIPKPFGGGAFCEEQDVSYGGWL